MKAPVHTAAGVVTTVDPSNGFQLAGYEETSEGQIDAILDRARRAAVAWRGVPVLERAKAVRSFGHALRERSDDLARLATREMGKPLTQSQAEVEKCAWTCEWFADHGPDLLAPETITSAALRSQVVYTPLGILFAILPWNFPYWQVIRADGPSGNGWKCGGAQARTVDDGLCPVAAKRSWRPPHCHRICSRLSWLASSGPRRSASGSSATTGSPR